jgi:hypothetical protein
VETCTRRDEEGVWTMAKKAKKKATKKKVAKKSKK